MDHGPRTTDHGPRTTDQGPQTTVHGLVPGPRSSTFHVPRSIPSRARCVSPRVASARSTVLHVVGSTFYVRRSVPSRSRGVPQGRWCTVDGPWSTFHFHIPRSIPSRATGVFPMVASARSTVHVPLSIPSRIGERFPRLARDRPRSAFQVPRFILSRIGERFPSAGERQTTATRRGRRIKRRGGGE